MTLTGCPMSWLEKGIVLSCYHLSFYPTGNHLLSYGDLKKGRLYMTTGWRVAVLKSRFKTFPKAKGAPPKRLWSLFGHLMLIRSTTASGIPGNHCICEVCSENWCDTPKTAVPTAARFFMTTPHHSTMFQVEWTGLWFSHLASPQPTTQLQSSKNTSTTNRMQKILSKNSLTPETWIFTQQK